MGAINGILMGVYAVVYVVSIQKNHLNEMVLLSTQNLCLNC